MVTMVIPRDSGQFGAFWGSIFNLTRVHNSHVQFRSSVTIDSDTILVSGHLAPNCQPRGHQGKGVQKFERVA